MKNQTYQEVVQTLNVLKEVVPFLPKRPESVPRWAGPGVLIRVEDQIKKFEKRAHELSPFIRENFKNLD